MATWASNLAELSSKSIVIFRADLKFQEAGDRFRNANTVAAAHWGMLVGFKKGSLVIFSFFNFVGVLEFCILRILGGSTHGALGDSADY